MLFYILVISNWMFIFETFRHHLWNEINRIAHCIGVTRVPLFIGCLFNSGLWLFNISKLHVFFLCDSPHKGPVMRKTFRYVMMPYQRLLFLVVWMDSRWPATDRCNRPVNHRWSYLPGQRVRCMDWKINPITEKRNMGQRVGASEINP